MTEFELSNKLTTATIKYIKERAEENGVIFSKDEVMVIDKFISKLDLFIPGEIISKVFINTDEYTSVVTMHATMIEAVKRLAHTSMCDKSLDKKLFFVLINYCNKLFMSHDEACTILIKQNIDTEINNKMYKLQESINSIATGEIENTAPGVVTRNGLHVVK
jgi:hypothetical protein